MAGMCWDTVDDTYACSRLGDRVLIGPVVRYVIAWHHAEP